MRAFIAVCSGVLFLCSSSFTSVYGLEQKQSSGSDADIKSCLSAAKKALGPTAEVLKCGKLTGREGLEAVAALRIRRLKQTPENVAVSRLVVLRRSRSGWKKELNVHREITNSAGYVGIDFIDDSSEYHGYYVSFSDHRSDDTPAFVMYLSEIEPNGDPEWPVQIAWNPAVQRFQEYAGDRDPEGFRPELKNPSHKNLKDCGGCRNPRR